MAAATTPVYQFRHVARPGNRLGGFGLPGWTVQKASNRRSPCQFPGTSTQHRIDCTSQVTVSGLLSAATNVDEVIIDPAAVAEPAGRIDHEGLGNMRWVQASSKGPGLRSRRFADQRKPHPELRRRVLVPGDQNPQHPNPAAGSSTMETSEHRHITAADRAGLREKHDNGRGRFGLAANLVQRAQRIAKITSRDGRPIIRTSRSHGNRRLSKPQWQESTGPGPQPQQHQQRHHQARSGHTKRLIRGSAVHGGSDR